MEFLKRNGVGLAAILCCCVLGVLWAQQNGQLQELRRENADLTARLDDAEKVEEPEVPAAPSAKILSSSVDPETRMLTLETAAEVPGLEDYYVDIGLCQPGEAYRMAWQWASLKQQADGTYAGTLTFPLDLDRGLELRSADDTVLFSSGSITDLLPLRLDSEGTSYHFNSEEQKFYVCDFDVQLADPAGGEAQGRDGEFRLYRNGKLVFTGKKARDGDSSLLVNGEPCESVGADCTEGDRMGLCYACTDDAGLRYEFPLFEILTWKWDGTERYPISGRPTVTWAE